MISKRKGFRRGQPQPRIPGDLNAQWQVPIGVVNDKMKKFEYRGHMFRVELVSKERIRVRLDEDYREIQEDVEGYEKGIYVVIRPNGSENEMKYVIVKEAVLAGCDSMIEWWSSRQRSSTLTQWVEGLEDWE